MGLERHAQLQGVGTRRRTLPHEKQRTGTIMATGAQVLETVRRLVIALQELTSKCVSSIL